jgi:hypothetical protein
MRPGIGTAAKDCTPAASNSTRHGKDAAREEGEAPIDEGVHPTTPQ